ncbi:MAG: phosphatase PAP2 family protein [Candidatus Binatia bacterium]
MKLTNKLETLELSLWFLTGLVTAIASVVFFAWLSGEVLEGDTVRFDETIRALINGHASPRVTAIMQAITVLGSVFFLSCSSGIIGLLFMLKRSRRSLFVFSTTMLGATILNVMLKVIIKRTRPASFFGTPLPSSFSFPSGHALLALCFYGILAYLITLRCNNLLLRFAAWSAAVLLAIAVGLSRIYLGVHYPSDVIAAYAAGIFWLLAVVIGDRLLVRSGKNNE